MFIHVHSHPPLPCHPCTPYPCSSIVVQWNSDSHEEQVVEWWPLVPPTDRLINGKIYANEKYYTTTPSVPTTYGADAMCGYPASTIGFINPGHQHVAKIQTNLMKPSTRYVYRYGSRVRAAE